MDDFDTYGVQKRNNEERRNYNMDDWWFGDGSTIGTTKQIVWKFD